MAIASIVLSIAAILISLLSLWQTHFAPFSPLAVSGRLTLRVFPIKNQDQRWFIASFNLPISITNEGARPGIIDGLRLRLHFPELPIPGNCEIIPATFEVDPSDANLIDSERFEWIDKLVQGDWMAFTVLPKATVTKHFLFESRWEEPVIQNLMECTLEMRSFAGTWKTVATWSLPMMLDIWSALDRGGSFSRYPHESDSLDVACSPPDLHKYTGTKDEIPKNGFSAPPSYLNYPKSEAENG